MMLHIVGLALLAVSVAACANSHSGTAPTQSGPPMSFIMTGSGADGTLLAGLTCGDWTSDSTTTQGQVGHSDGLGPNGDTSGALSSWNSAHSNLNCANTAPRGGAGRIYCFARG